MKHLSKAGAVAFVLWGLLHVAGGGMILSALSNGPGEGFAIYQNHEGTYTPLAGAILAYFAFLIVSIGAAAALVGVFLNWRNSGWGLAINTTMIGVTDIGLVIFLLSPGFVTVGEASIGIVLFVVGATFCTTAWLSERAVKVIASAV